MSITKPVWTEDVELHASASLAAAASATDDIDLDSLGADMARLVIEIVFGGSVDGNVLVELFHSANSGSDDDTIAAKSFIIPEDNSATKRRSIVITGTPYAAIKVTNNDSTDTVTYEAWYAWRQWDNT